MMIGSRRALLWSKQAIKYLFRDLFATAEAAPIANPRTCEPGPGTAALLDTANKMSIAFGQLQWSDGTGANNPAAVFQTQLVRASGLIAVFSIYLANTGRISFGLSNSSTCTVAAIGNGRRGSFDFNNTALNVSVSSNQFTGIGGVATVAPGVQYLLAIEFRTTGLRYLIKGGTFTDWTLIFDEQDAALTPLYAFLANTAAATSVLWDWVGAHQLTSPVWTVDANLYSVSQVNPPSGMAYTPNQIEGIFDLTVTAPNPLSGSAELRYDVISATDYSTAYFDSAGAFKVDSVVGGVAANKVNVAGVATVGLATGIKVIPRGTAHRFWTWNAASGWTNRGVITTMPACTVASIKAVYTDYIVTKLEAEPRTVVLPF